MTTLAPSRRRSHGRPATRLGANGLRVLDEEQVADLAERLGGRPVPGVRMSEREFVEWSFDRFDAEWVDGEVILMAPANEEHETLDEWFGRLLGDFIEQRESGVLLRNMFVRFPRRRRLRVPDLMFIAAANRTRIRPTFIDGPPDLVIEIVSPDSQNRDRREKYEDYQVGGVREYWIIDPLSRTLDAYALRGRRYQAIDLKDGRLHSSVLAGFYVRFNWLFGRHRPKVVQALKEMGVKG
jgi:Uma2 family endonuclease